MTNPYASPYFIAGAILFAFSGTVAYFWMSSFLYGAGYQGAPRRSVEAMLRMSNLSSSDYLFELGAGIGTVAFAAARERGARVLAVEIEPLRAFILRLRRALGPAAELVEIRRENMYDLNFGDATVISAFLWPGAMARLRPKFESELKPGTRIVSRCHPIPGWTPVEYDRKADVLLYVWPTSGPESPHDELGTLEDTIARPAPPGDYRAEPTDTPKPSGPSPTGNSA